ncbi:GUN4 domain-containing protein [Myxosarcina sp. GI1]|uniref:GUN4 domain-containing protein n=1 Tax=Myxosarcina sp. GI1 TaxID=1541065 RepID=UPI00068B67CD|nr:GUN4 domain-containing protein [Myxosarcina sp. GI1]
MSESQEITTSQLAKQLAAIQEQLTKMTGRFDAIEERLETISALPKKMSELEDDLMLLGDRYRYKNLQQYLAEENWFEADKETIRLILAVSKREIEELTPEDIQHFPCNDLMVIDRLWSKYSNGRFGFSVQLNAYQKLGGNLDSTVEQNQQLIEQWGENLGWRKNNRWLKCKDLDFSLNAPEGCHPSRWWNSPYGSKMTNFFLGRLMTCKLAKHSEIDMRGREEV